MLKKILFLLFIVGFTINNCNGQNTTLYLPKGYYIIFYVPGVYQENKTTYISEPIYYPGFEECSEELPFKRDAEKSFENYLGAYYSDTFKYGAEITYIENVKNSTSVRLETLQQAKDRLYQLIADENKGGFEVQQTTFSFKCEN